MRKLTSISVSRRSLAISATVCFTILLAFIAILALGAELEWLRESTILLTALVTSLGVAVVGLLEQRRRYVSRIRNLDRSFRRQLGDSETRLKRLAAVVEKLQDQAEKEVASEKLRKGRQDEIELRAMLRSSLLSDHVNVPMEFFSREEATRLAQSLVTEDPLRAHFLLAQQGSFAEMLPGPKRRLSIELRSRGYLEKSLEVLESIAATTQSERDLVALRNRRSELEILRGQYEPKLAAGIGKITPVAGHVLHIVGKALPKTQSGYTLRTHYTARAQLQSGVRVSVVSQMGEGVGGDIAAQDVIDGVTYHSLAGKDRTSQTLEEWLDANIAGVAEVVRETRPSLLHAHSDFYNAKTAQIVGAHFGLPVVYENRGFWEESWLSRVSQKYSIGDWEAEAARWGMPDVYTLRSARETDARKGVDHVFTLARVMKSHIEAQGLAATRISLVPNAVSVEDFPVLERDTDLTESMGIPQAALVIGYISSIVEYEGIDTLLEAFHTVRGGSQRDLRLVIVGDGPFLPELKKRNAELGGADVIFTGRVPHEDVLNYYSLIDIFVVPRKPSTVCQLVTPLKPFEAFSTGRAVIMSDVKALKEIALDSGAASLFEAGNSESLAVRLRELIEDEELRLRLASTGASWVRNVRTWSANAAVYQKVYDEMGVLKAVEPDGSFVFSDEDYAGLLDWVRGEEPLNYSNWFDRLTKFTATDVIQNGWTYADFPVVILHLPMNWETPCSSNRTWAFNLHTWEFMDPVVRDYLESENISRLRWCVDRALSWIQRYVSTNQNPEAPESMAWYDMALALRSPRLVALIHLSIRAGLEDEIIKRLVDGAIRHAREHLDERSFNSRTNHGYYAAMGQVVLATGLQPLHEMDRLNQQGQERLALMASTQFLEDGIHSEHSPDYHKMLLESFQLAINNRLIRDGGAISLMKKAAYALGWMIKPDGALVQFGDTPERIMTGGRIGEWNDPHTRFLRSRGRQGTPDERTFAIFPSSGYAFVRYPQPESLNDHTSASYLAFAAAFHSRAHKHADDLNVVWSDHGSEILVDGGRYGYEDLLPADSPLRLKGYYYGAPERQYVESTLAHNTVEYEGQNHDRRNRKPYGSGIGECYGDEGLYVLNGTVDQGEWAHHREISFRAGEWLIVQDDVVAHGGGVGDFRAWFNLAGHLDVTLDKSVLRVDSRHWRVPLWITSAGTGTLIEPSRGERDPLRGWRSVQDRSLTETWSFGYGLYQAAEGTITTVFNFGEGPLDVDPR